MSDWMQLVLFAAVLVVFLGTALVTLLGIVGKLTVPNAYLKPLVAVVLVEVALAIIFVFKTIDFSQASASDFIKSLPAELQTANAEEVSREIAELFRVHGGLKDQLSRFIEPSDKLPSTPEQVRAKIAELLSDHSDLKRRLDQQEEHFIIRLVRFNQQARVFGTLNFTYAADSVKQRLAGQFLGLLFDLGRYPGPVTNDPTTAKAALADYQKAVGIQSNPVYNQKTFYAMLRDHVADAT